MEYMSILTDFEDRRIQITGDSDYRVQLTKPKKREISIERRYNITKKN